MQNVPSEFNHGALQAEANAEEWFRLCAGPFDGSDLAFDATRTESTGNENTTETSSES